MWVQLEWTCAATGDEKFILLWVNNGGNGNVIFDEAFLVSKVDFLSCRTSLTFAPGKILKFFIIHVFIYLPHVDQLTDAIIQLRLSWEPSQKIVLSSVSPKLRFHDILG